MIESVNGYIVGEPLGRGGMSRVYHGRHETLGYPVAIKFLEPGLATDQKYIERFEREARQASSLKNPAVVDVIDFGRKDSLYYIVMEYVNGRDLSLIFDDFERYGTRQHFFPAEIALLILEAVCRGLQHAHDNGVIHRDIKPSNILLTHDGYVKIVDFGLARDLLPTSPEITATGVVIGTPAYMAPEQALGDKDLDARCDVFALGSLFYHLLSGIKPFQGSRPSEVQEQIIKESPAPLTRQTCPQLEPCLAALISRMLAKDRVERFSDAGELLPAVQDCLELVDHTGSVLKLRHENLRKFAEEPVKYSESLRQMNIAARLKRGYHHQSLGPDHLVDATLEFSRVTCLDPNNREATRVLGELRNTADETGLDWNVVKDRVRECGETQVLDPADTPGSQGRSMRPLLLLLIPLVLVIGVWMLFAMKNSEPGPEVVAEEFTAVSGQSDSLLVQDKLVQDPDRSLTDPAPAHEDEPLEDNAPSGALVDQEAQSVTPEFTEPDPAPLPLPTVRLQSAETVEVLRNGRQIWNGSGTHDLEVEPRQSQKLRVLAPSLFAEQTITIPPLDRGSRHVVRVAFTTGTLTVAAQVNMSAKLDGQQLDAAASGKYENLRVGAGSHELTVSHPGYVAVGAWLYTDDADTKLPVLRTDEQGTTFVCDITAAVNHQIYCEFKRLER